MKKLLLALCFLSLPCFASGKMGFGVNRFVGAKKTVAPELSLSIWEPIALGISYESCTGIGVNVDEEVWFGSKHDLVFPVTEYVDLSLGATLRVNPKNESDVHASLQIPLW